MDKLADKGESISVPQEEWKKDLWIAGVGKTIN